MAPRILGDYELHTPLGQGAMGVVWQATHRRRGVRAAVKTLPAGRSEATVQALQREVVAIGRLDHPNVVSLFDQGTEDGAPWLAMELADGVLQLPGSWPELRRSLDEVLAGLAAAHAEGLLHLDIKPSNVLVRDGTHLLADFGISHGLSRDEARGVWGSPAFMAPEAFDGRPGRLGRATDLYSAGCLAWTLATGRPPFAGSPRDLADAHRTVPLPSLAPRVPVPPGFEAWLHRLLAKRPTERFQCAADARQALRDLPEAAVGPVETGPAVLAPTVTTCTVATPMAIAALEPTEAPPGGSSCPECWPPAPPIDGWSRGCGLVGLLAVPWLDRPEPQAALWASLKGLFAGQGDRVRLGGFPGSGRSRMLQRFLGAAHRHAGAETLLVDRPLADALAHAFGTDPDALALRFARRREDVVPYANLLQNDPFAALRALPTLLRAPLVVGVDGPSLPPLDGAPMLVVEVVDGPGDLTLRAMGDKATRRLLAAWASLDPQAVADVCDVTEGDLDASVALVAEGIRAGTFVQSERGWRPVAPQRLAVPAERKARWAHHVDRLRDQVPDAALRRIAVLRHPGLHADDPSTVEALEALGWLHDGTWVSSIGRMALVDTLGDLRAEHLTAAARLDGWDRGEHLFAAGEVDAASHLLLEEAWREAARGRMSRVQFVLGRLQAAMENVPEDDPRWGHLHCSLARLGPTHQGYATSAAHAQRAAALARAHHHEGEWAAVGRSAVGHLLFHADIRLHPAGTEGLLREFASLAEDNAHGHYLAGWIHLREGDVWRTMREAWRAGEVGRARGDRYRVMVSRLLYWIGAHAAGHPEAEPRYARHSRAFLDAGYLSAEMDAAMCWGDMLRRDGRLQEAAERYAHALRVATEGEARADVGPFLGAAQCERALGRPEQALDLLRAARLQLRDAGPTWAALIDLYEACARLEAGGSADATRVEAALDALQASGYLDADVLDALDVLCTQGVAARTAARFRTDAQARLDGFRAAEAGRGPMPDYPDTDP